MCNPRTSRSRQRYRLTLVAPDNETREQSDRRLRAAIKALGRQFALRCEKAIEVGAEHQKQREPKENHE